VKLFSNEDEDSILDLSKSTWSYKVGMNVKVRETTRRGG